jgi:hypothetical protein
MELNFIFSNLNVIILAVWVLFLLIVAIRFFRPVWMYSNNGFISKVIFWFKNVSYKKLIISAFGLNILYGLFITWGQYYVWSISTDYVKSLVTLPLSKETPLPYLMEWTRPIFEKDFGYFLYYVLGRFWLYIIISFIISGFLYFIFKTWKSQHGNFRDDGPQLLLILMLIVGWPGILVLIPLGFILSILYSFMFYFKGKREVDIEPAFVVASFITLIFGNIVIRFF